MHRTYESSLRWYWLTPLFAIGLFVAMMVGILWWLNQEEQSQQRMSLYRDVETLQQTLQLKLLSHQETLQSYARNVGLKEMEESDFYIQAGEWMNINREVVGVSWVNADRHIVWAVNSGDHPNKNWHQPEKKLADAETLRVFDISRDDRRAVYSRPFFSTDRRAFMEIHVPVIWGARFMGVIMATYSLNQLIEAHVFGEMKSKYKIVSIDERGHVLTNTSSRPDTEATTSYELPIYPLDYGIHLRVYSFAGRTPVLQNAMLWLVLGLSLIIVWLLFNVWRHTQRRALAERALLQETNFRRAMENSLLTGLRALDLEGRIVYINPAFCRMTGFSEQELIGHVPPFPYWPPEHLAENVSNMRMVIEGRAPVEGVEVLVQRKNGTRFFSRMYVSPLINEHGVQTGWITSMTDITEPKLIRENLAAAHERFTAVLEGLDAAVSVYAQEKIHDGELLFANRYYRQWVDTGVADHLASALEHRPMLNHETNEGAADEVYSPEIDRWFEVRRRRIEWVDGRIVTMQIATDITQRKKTDDLARQQEAKIAFTSRLITMGEMASSLAHELNQPLTAIASYSMGTVARIQTQLSQGGTLNAEELLPTLEKTSAQARRAGAIIRRIRDFVKRREPQRQLVNINDIIEDAIDLANIDAVKHRVTLRVDIDPTLPRVPIDPILIQQVLINLLKNGIESMTQARLRTLILRAGLVNEDERAWLEIQVQDHGHGLANEASDKLFEPFYTTKADGMGMGLNICRSIVEFHQGRLWANNHVDAQGTVSGCIFYLRLPLETTTS